MSDTMSSSSSEHWLQFVTDVSGDVPPVSGPATGAGPDTGGRTATSTAESHVKLAPKSCLSKPVRRRSRASQRTPTTLLNTNTENFRALVQKFTGCPSNSISLAAQKGPVTLNFGGNHNQYYNNYKLSSSSSSVLAPVAYNIYQQQCCHDQQQLLHDHHHHQQQEQCVYSSLNHVGSDHVYFSGDKEDNNVVVGDEDGLSMENMSYSLHELLDLGRDSNFFMNGVTTSHDHEDIYFTY